VGAVSSLSALRARLAAIWERLRLSFWFVPALMSAGAAVLALITLAVDAGLSDEAPSRALGGPMP
jgi:uncharacterized membrane protein